MEMTTPPLPDDDNNQMCHICKKRIVDHSFEQQQACSDEMGTTSRSSCRYCGGQVISDKPSEYCSKECSDADQEEIRRARAGHNF